MFASYRREDTVHIADEFHSGKRRQRMRDADAGGIQKQEPPCVLATGITHTRLGSLFSHTMQHICLWDPDSQ